MSQISPSRDVRREPASPLPGWYVRTVLVIPDGHRRYAQRHRVDLRDVYERSIPVGMAFAEVLLSELGVTSLIFYVISLRNLVLRSGSELDAIFRAFVQGLSRFATSPLVRSADIRVKVLGQRSLWPHDVSFAARRASRLTRSHRTKEVVFLLAYSGRLELEKGLRCLLRDRSSQRTDRLIDRLWRYLEVRKPIDIVIRTGGSVRLTDAPILPTLDAEFVSIPKPFPELTRDDIISYLRRACSFPQGELRNHLVDPEVLLSPRSETGT